MPTDDEYTRTPEQVQALADGGFCLGSDYLPRAYDLAVGEGMCVHCQRYVPLAGRLVARHAPRNDGEVNPPGAEPRTLPRGVRT